MYTSEKAARKCPAGGYYSHLLEMGNYHKTTCRMLRPLSAGMCKYGTSPCCVRRGSVTTGTVTGQREGGGAGVGGRHSLGVRCKGFLLDSLALTKKTRRLRLSACSYDKLALGIPFVIIVPYVQHLTREAPCHV